MQIFFIASLTSLQAWLYQEVTPTPVTRPSTSTMRLRMTRLVVEWVEALFCLSCRGLMVEAMLRFSLLRSSRKFYKSNVKSEKISFRSSEKCQAASYHELMKYKHSLCLSISKAITRFCFSCSI